MSRFERIIRWALIILAAILVVLLIFLFFQYQALRNQQIFGARAARWSFFLDHHAPLLPTDASVIRSWMTFDYINHLFALPPDYLKQKLDIVNVNYPRLTVSNYAKAMDASTTVMLGEVEQAVGKYASSTPAATTPPVGTSTPAKSASA